jgi:GNAT superfamily N-acetyltransferase
MTACVVTPAASRQTAQVLALLSEGLPALASPLDPPVRLFIAHAPGQPERLMGAAALWPVPQSGGVWGFRVHCQVLPACRLQGIGRALVRALGAEAARWGVPQLITWGTLPDGPASDFTRAVGGQEAFALHHFLTDQADALPHLLRTVERLHRLGHVPPGFVVRSLHEVPRAPVLALHCQEFSANPIAAAALFDSRLANPVLRDLSVALWDGRHLAGYLLAALSSDLPEVDFMAAAPEHRSGWPATLMRHAFVERGMAAGWSQARYHCNALSRAPMHFAKRTGAVLERITRGWSLPVACDAVQAPVGGITVHRPAPAAARTVRLSLAGLDLRQARHLCSQGLLPNLAALLAEGGVEEIEQRSQAVPAASGLQAGMPTGEALAVRHAGWPIHQGPSGVALQDAACAWVSEGFDDTRLAAPDFWALDPQCVWPPTEIALARQARMHPSEVGAAHLAAVLGALDAAVQQALQPASARLIARWASLHNLGVHWAGLPDWHLLALRFDGLPTWLAEAALDKADADTVLAAWWGFFDLMLGRYRQLLGTQAAIRVEAPSA